MTAFLATCMMGIIMAHKKTTSKKIARKASDVLRDPKASKKAKSLGGSALSQSAGKHRRKKRK